MDFMGENKAMKMLVGVTGRDKCKKEPIPNNFHHENYISNRNSEICKIITP